MKYRTKLVEIEAFQLTKETREDNSNWPDWMHEAWNKELDEVGSLYPWLYPDSDGSDELAVETLNGAVLVRFNDYIIRGTQGELYPCDPDVFHEKYEKCEKYEKME